MSAFMHAGPVSVSDEQAIPQELALYISAPAMIGVSGLLWAAIYFTFVHLLP
jgi:hypothetical protein